MKKLVKLDINKDIKANVLEDYLCTDYLYIPVYPGFKLKINTNSLVLKEQIILETDKKIPVYSPISGIVKGGTYSLKYNNQKIKTVVIENNFKEELLSKKASTKDIKKITKDKFIKTLETMGIVDTDNEELSLYKRFINTDNLKLILIKSYDNEPYIENIKFELQNNMQKILETIDALNNIFKTYNAHLLINELNSECITLYNDYIGSYPNISIKLLPNRYPLYNDSILKENLYSSYNDDEILILSIDNLMNIYNAIKRHRQITEKYITISGDAIAEQKVINTKIGTKVIDIINNCIKIKYQNVEYFVNGILSGTKIDDINKLIVTNDFQGIIINKKVDLIPEKCINCGLCYKVCPMNINPKNINKEKCIKCGLCNYICPANIKLLGGDE